MRKLRDSSGFTLAELLITCVLISILALSMAAFLTNWLQSYADSNARTMLLDNAEQALSVVSRDIRLSGSADSQNRWPDANSPSGDYGWQSSANTLVLAKAATNNSGNIIFSDPNKYITEKDNVVYFVSGSTLFRRLIASDDPSDSAVTSCPKAQSSASCPVDQIVATGVNSFSVKYYDAGENEVAPDDARSIALDITLQQHYGGQTLSVNYSTRMAFRNE